MQRQPARNFKHQGETSGTKDVEETVSKTVDCLLSALPPLSSNVFADLDGTPLEQSTLDDDSFLGFETAVLECFENLKKLLRLLGEEQVSSLAAVCNPESLTFEPTHSSTTKIEEYMSNEDPDIIARVILAVSTYIPCAHIPSPWATSATTAAAQQLLHQLAARLVDALGPLPSELPPNKNANQTIKPGCSIIGGWNDAQKAVQQLVISALPQVLQLLRHALIPTDHSKNGRAVEALSSGSTAEAVFQRFLAATRLSSQLCQLHGSGIDVALPATLPYLLACLDDSSHAVQCCALVALRHCAIRGSIRWQEDLLVDRMLSMLGVCEIRVWPAALAAAHAVVSSCAQGDKGSGQSSEAYSRLLSQMLAQTGRQPESVEWAAPALHLLPRLAPSLGILMVPCFSRLLPLLLRWAAVPAGTAVPAGALPSWQGEEGLEGARSAGGPGAPEAEPSVAAGIASQQCGEGGDEPGAAGWGRGGEGGVATGGIKAQGQGAVYVKVLALRALHAVILHTWPRMPAHAGYLLRGLGVRNSPREGGPRVSYRKSLAGRGGEGASSAEATAREWEGKCVEALWCCGGEEARGIIQRGGLVDELQLEKPAMVVEV